MQLANPAEETRLAKEMVDAREAWHQASEEMKVAMELFHDLQHSSDGLLKMRMASQNETSAIKRYRQAVEAYAKAVSDHHRE